MKASAFESVPVEPQALEEWILARLQDASVTMTQWADALTRLHTAGGMEKAEACAELLQDTFLAARAEDKLLALLKLRAAWHGTSPEFRSACAGVWKAFYGDTPPARWVELAGFAENLAAAECLRRLEILRGLQPGRLCYEKTWGFGKIVEVDDFSRQVVINFEKKTRHRLALAYAAETLQLPAADHLLARHHRDPAGTAAWIEQNPAAVVKSALHSLGPMNVSRLQELLVERLLPADQWKRFWDTARKNLKTDPLVEFPAKRQDPLRLRASAQTCDSAWWETFLRERDFSRIFSLIEEWRQEADQPEMPPTVRQALENRLAFVIQGADKTQWHWRVLALMTAEELGLACAGDQMTAQPSALLQPAVFLSVTAALPARKLAGFLRWFQRRHPDQAAALWLQIMDQLSMPVLNEIIAALMATGRETSVDETLRRALADGSCSCEMLYWISRHAEWVADRGLITRPVLARTALRIMENRRWTGDRLKARNLLRDLFTQSGWIETVLPAMDAQQRLDLARHIQRSPLWTGAERNTILLLMIRLVPELQEVLRETPTPAVRWTSWRTYRERQAQLAKLINEDIPRNSREIAVARGYGDLRENFEYKTARETQAILMRRRAEFESLLTSVKGTDFTGFPATVAGMAASVKLRRTDGTREQYTILGEWDSDATLHIISCKSKLAEALGGHAAGETVALPAESGTAPAVIEEITGLTPEIKAWVNGAPPAAR